MQEHYLLINIRENMSNFDDYKYKDNTKIISLQLKQSREKKLYPWEISTFLGKFNTYYYKSEVINTIAIALKQDISAENIMVFDKSFNISNQNSQLSYLSLTDSDIKYLYYIGLPYSLLPNKTIYLLNRLFFYFRNINEFLFNHKGKRINRDNLGKLYEKFNTYDFNSMILLLKEYVADSLNNITLEKSQITLLNKIYDNFNNDYLEYELDETEIERFKVCILSNTLTSQDLKNKIYNKYFKDFYYYLNNIQRPFVVVKNQSTNILTVLCRGQFNKDDIKSSTLDLKSISHNSPFKAIIKGGIELFRIFIPGDRLNEIKNKQETIEILTASQNDIDIKKDLKSYNEIQLKIDKISKEKETLLKIYEVEKLGNINNVDSLRIENIKNNLKEEEETNQTKSKNLLSKYNFEADLELTDTEDFYIDMAV